MTYQKMDFFCTSTTIPLSSSGYTVFIETAGFIGYSYDLNLTSSAANGTLYLYSQCTNPVGDTFVGVPFLTIPISGGQYSGSQTRYTIDSNNLITRNWTILSWTGSDSSDGHIAIVGNVQINQ
jgi:hypothetical protein